MGNELEERQAAQVEAAYRAILDGEELPGAGSDPEAATRAILERIIASPTFEDAFRPQTLEPWRDYLGVPVFVRDFKLNPSTVEGQSVYAVCDLEVVGSEETVTVTCGGKNVLVQLVMMLERGWLDKPVVLTSKQTGEGFTVLWLQDASAATAKA